MFLLKKTLLSAGGGIIAPPPRCVGLRVFFLKAISISQSFSAGLLKVDCSSFQAENQKTKFTKLFRISEKNVSVK